MPSTALRLCLLAAAVIPIACGSPAAEPAWRFLEHTNEVQRRWPEGVARQPPVKLRPWNIARSRRFKLYEVEMRTSKSDLDARVALLAPAGSSYEVAVDLPRKPVLRLALGYLMEPEAPGGNLTFRISVRTAEGAAETILDENVVTGEAGAWRELSIPLERWQNRQVVLLFSTHGGEAWGAWAAPEITGGEDSEAGWDVILVSLDTLRADHLGCYGYHRPTSPNLDALAARSFRFGSAVSQSPWTRPSHKALFTGVFPASDGGLRSPRLAEVLWREGYRTAAFTGGGQVDRRFGFMGGFETYRVLPWLRNQEPILRWIEERRGRPRFLFLHTYEIHDTYRDRRFARSLPAGRLPEYFSKQVWWSLKNSGLSELEQAYVEALYDGGIASADELLGSLLERLEENGLLERSVIIVTSDHGEQFWEHGSWRHGGTMYDHQLLVPLIVYLPPRLRERRAGGRATPGGVIEEQVSLVDLYPTILDLLGIELGHEIHGRSLVPHLVGRKMASRKAFSENTNSRTEKKALRTERYKFIYSYPKGKDAGGLARWELYDLAKDPGEQQDLAEQYPEEVARLLAEIDEMRGPHELLAEEVPADISPSLRRELEALGYLGVE